MDSPEPLIPMSPHPENLGIPLTGGRGSDNSELPGRFGKFRAFSEPFLEVSGVVRPLRRAPKACLVSLF